MSSRPEEVFPFLTNLEEVFNDRMVVSGAMYSKDN